MNNEKEKSRTPDFMKFLTYSTLLFIALLLISCSDDNPVKPPPTPNIPDTVNKYEWTLDTIFGYNCDKIYTADSVNVFIAAYPAPLFYNGVKYSEIDMMDPLFICLYPAGFDKNNVFFGGAKSGTYLDDPILKKWTYGSVNSYTLGNDSGAGIYDIYVLGTDECWVSTRERNRVYHFNSGFLTKYSLDAGQKRASFFNDNSGTLFAFSYEVIGENDFKTKFYKFENDSFLVIDSNFINLPTTEIFARRCGNDMLSSKSSSILYFDGLKWQNMCSTPSFKPYEVSGISKSNFMCYGQSDESSWQIYIWDGNKWTMEGSKNIYHHLALGANISATQNDANIILNTEMGISIHMRGKRKMN